MSLLQPTGLWFLVALPVILVLYLIQSRYRPQVVASLLLWKRMARDLEAEAAWRRPRLDVLLVLQLLVALMAGLALARPGIVGGGSQRLVVVLDVSASMAARDVPPTRFAAARQQVADIVNAAAPDARISLLTAGIQPRVVVEDGSPANILGVLDSLHAEPDAGDLPSALRVAAGLAAPDANNGSQVIAITDGAFSLDLPRQTVPISFRLVGGGPQDLAVSEVSLRRPVESTNYLAGFVRIVNFGANAQTTSMTILADGLPVDRSSVDVPALGHSEATFRVPPTAGSVSVALSQRGPLAGDDTVDVLGYPHWNRRVKIVSDAPAMWEHVLSVVPNVSVRSIAPADFTAASASSDDILLLDSGVSNAETSSDLIVIDPPDTSPLLPRVDALPRQRMAVSFDPQDPLLVGLDVAPLNVQQLKRAATPAWAAAAVAAEDTPLILHGRLGDRRAVVFAFDPNKSNLPHLAAFPLLMANVVDWLTPGRGAMLRGGLGAKTNIQPRPQADLPAASGSMPVPSTSDIWPWLIAAAGAFFALEWAVAIRRG